MKKRTSSMGIVLCTSPDRPTPDVLLLCIENEWVFPKGHVNEGETELAAAIREIGEETSVRLSEVDHLGLITEFSFYFEGEQALKVIRVHGFLLSEPQTVLPNASEGFSDGGWFPANEAIEKLTHNDAREALRIALAKAADHR